MLIIVSEHNRYLINVALITSLFSLLLCMLFFFFFFKSESISSSAKSDSLRPHGLQLTRLLCPGDSPGKNSGVGFHVFLQGIFLTQGLSHKGSYCYHYFTEGDVQGSERLSDLLNVTQLSRGFPNGASG